jgi:uncharacterized protein (TIGR02147 family)
MPRPDIFAYLDYRAFLEAWFAWRKEENPRVSHRAIARRVGERSPSFLADLIKGRRNLTAVRRDALSKVVGLDEDEDAFFALLVAFEQAADVDEKQRVWERVAGTKRFRAARRIEGDSYAYLAHWYYPAVRELVRRPDFQLDPAWVAAELRPPISAEEAQQALAALWNLGMLTRDDAGDVSQAEGAIATPRQVQGMAVHAYHRGMLERARDGVAQFEWFERHYVGVTVCIPESLVPRLKQELDTAASWVLDLCEQAEDPAERVYQLNFNLVPLSRRLGEGEPER